MKLRSESVEDGDLSDPKGEFKNRSQTSSVRASIVSRYLLCMAVYLWRADFGSKKRRDRRP